jgi:hypothetical protein
VADDALDLGLQPPRRVFVKTRYRRRPAARVADIRAGRSLPDAGADAGMTLQLAGFAVLVLVR